MIQQRLDLVHSMSPADSCGLQEWLKVQHLMIVHLKDFAHIICLDISLAIILYSLNKVRVGCILLLHQHRRVSPEHLSIITKSVRHL